ncbi:MAG: universal stress protein [cyanobacterium endosymbiont of Epithemia adnata isolate EadnSB Bon19]|jgi:nucleotide-binding universal stress UspA family protein
MFTTVLFPMDKSREAREAAEIVANIVKTYNSHLILLSVIENPLEEENIGQESIMGSADVVAKLLQAAQALFANKGIEADLIEREGMPSFAICDVADEVNADLIIMGCRGLGLTMEGASESVTNRVINLSPCPVLIIP